MSKKKKTASTYSLANSNFIALILLTIINVSTVVMMVIAGRFIDIQAKTFLTIIVGFVLVVVIIDILYYLGYIKGVRLGRKAFIWIAVIMTLINSVGTFYLYRGNSLLNQFINQDGVENVEYAIITMDADNTLENMQSQKVGYIAGDEIYKKDIKREMDRHAASIKLSPYGNHEKVLKSLVADDVPYAVVPSDFRMITRDETLKKDLREAIVLARFNIRVQGELSDVDVLNEPFSVLMLGNNEGLSDSIIVMTVNPKTLRITMTSLARDSYVPIACSTGQYRDKLNHARARSRDCMIQTIEDYVDIDIDFYVETDFYALVKIVDALGGVEITSPIAFGGSLPVEDGYEDEFDEVYVREGTFVRDGKEAITFARERYHLSDNDFGRQRNQQYVIKQIATKIMETRNIDTLLNVLEVSKDNMSTDLPVSAMSSLMGYALRSTQGSPVNTMDTFRIVSSQITGETPTISGMSVVVPDAQSLAEVIRLMKNNLETEIEFVDAKSFEFDYNNPYVYQIPEPFPEDYTHGSNYTDYFESPIEPEEAEDTKENETSDDDEANDDERDDEDQDNQEGEDNDQDPDDKDDESLPPKEKPDAAASDA